MLSPVLGWNNSDSYRVTRLPQDSEPSLRNNFVLHLTFNCPNENFVGISLETKKENTSELT